MQRATDRSVLGLWTYRHV